VSLGAVVVATLALGLRLLVLAQMRGLPFFGQPISDARVYFDLAGRIAAGDWLLRDVGVFYQAPLYPYLMAPLRVLWSRDGALAAVRSVQIAAAALAVFALANARDEQRRGTGLAAAVLLALYAPAVFTDQLIGKESLGLTLSVVLLVLLLGPTRRTSAPRLILAGFVLGLVALLRENALVLAPVIAAWLLAGRDDDGSARRWHRAALFAAGVALPLLVVTARNLAVGGSATPTTFQSGPNFYIGNHAGAGGSYVPLVIGHGDPVFERADAVALAERGAGHRLSPSEVCRWWWRQGVDFWRRSPGAALALLGRKTLLLLGAYEVPDAEDFAVYREASTTLRALAVFAHFGVLFPLAMAGLVLGELPPRVRSLLVVWLLLAAASTVAFFVLGRYRFLLVPPLVMLAGSGLVALPSALRERRLARLAAALAVGVAAALLANSQPPRAPTGLSWVNVGVSWAMKGRFEEAEASYRRALAVEPGLFEAHLDLGNLELVLGRAGEALPHLALAAALAPGDAEAARQHGLALQQLGRGADAERELRRARALEAAARR